MASRSQSPAGTQPNPPIAERRSDILNQNLPNILYSKDRTTVGSSLHSIKFVGRLEKWQKFEDEVMRFAWHNDPISPNPIISFRIHPPGEYDLHNELVHCGDELSVSGRFTQNVLNPVTSAARVMNNDTRFGDFKICQEAHKVLSLTTTSESKEAASDTGNQGRKIPDFVAVDKKDGKSRFLGEAKTPWSHNLEDYIKKYKANRKGDLDKAFGKCWTSFNISYAHAHPLLTGQVADYMYAFSMKYAFITTYEQTIFLKQDGPEGGPWTLYFSEPIKHLQGLSAGEAHPEPQLSLRRCMLWLCAVTSGVPKNYQTYNKTPVEKWVKDKTKNHSQLFSPCQKSLDTSKMGASPLVEKTLGSSAIRPRRVLVDQDDPLNTPSRAPRQQQEQRTLDQHYGYPRQQETQHSGASSRASSQEPREQRGQRSLDPHHGYPHHQGLHGSRASSQESRDRQGQRMLHQHYGYPHQQEMQHSRSPSREPREQRGQRSLNQHQDYSYQERLQDLRAPPQESREPRGPGSLGQPHDLPTRQVPQAPPVPLYPRRSGGLKGKFNGKQETFKEEEVKRDRDGHLYVMVKGRKYPVRLA